MQLQAKFPATVQTISLNLDYDNDDGSPPQKLQDEVLEILRKQKITTRNLICSGECDSMLEALDVLSLPAVLVFGPDGKLQKSFENEFTSDDVATEVELLTK